MVVLVCIGLKDWGLHPIIEHSTLEDIYKRLQSGELEGASRVSLEIPDDVDFKCLVQRSLINKIINSAHAHAHEAGNCL
jgi:hypothetical protein